MSASTVLLPRPRSPARLITRLGYWPVWACALLSLVLALSLLRQQQAQQRVEQRLQVEQRLALLRDRLEAVAQTSFSPTLGLATLIQVDGGINEQRFEQLIQRTLNLVPYLRSVVAAPDDVARHVYPHAGNEAVLDLDYRSIAPQWAQVQEARQRQQPILRAPVRLVQGGLGVIQRTPVFLRSEAGAPPRYWGVVSVVADLERFIHATGLPEDALLELALYADTADGRPPTPIWGRAPAELGDGVRQTARLPGADWQLLARPRGGWQNASPWNSQLGALLAGCGLLTLLVAALTRQWHALSRHNEALAAQIEQGQELQQRLEQSQARFRSLAGLASDWVWEQDAELRFTYISRQAEEASNTDSAQVLGHRRWESPALVPGVDWQAHQGQLERRETFRDFEYAQYSADGSLRHLSVSGAPIFDARGQFQGYRGTGRNVTATRQAEVALRASQAALEAARDRLQAVLDAAVEVAIVATDTEDRILVFNRGAERMLGYSEAEVLGRSPHLWHLPEEMLARASALRAELQRPVAPAEAFVAKPLQAGSDTQVWTLVRRDGSRLEASLTISSVLARDGRALGFLGVARDISAQLRAERELRALNVELEQRVSARTAELSAAMMALQHAQEELLRAERMAALGSLVAGVAHELNTPLGNCLTTASTLEGRNREIALQLESGQMRRSSLEAYLHDTGLASDILLRGLSSACELVQHFKQLAVDQTSEQRRVFLLEGVVSDVLGLARARWKSTPYRIETAIDLPRALDSFPGPLGQVLSNLLQNALLHAFEGREQGLLSIAARALSDQEFELSVADDGRGMSEEERRRAFDPFFTTKLGRGGTGLGLNIVYNIVKDVLGGQLELQSRPGAGSRFVFRLPYVAPQLRR